MKFLRDATPFTQILFTMIVILVGGIFVSLIGFLGCWLGMGISFETISTMMANVQNPENVHLLKFFQILQTVGMFILPPLVLAYYLDDKPFRYLSLNENLPGFFLVWFV